MRRVETPKFPDTFMKTRITLRSVYTLILESNKILSKGRGILFGEGDLSGLCLSPGRSAHAGEEVGGLRVDGSPSTLLFCGCELEEADGWLSIFS